MDAGFQFKAFVRRAGEPYNPTPGEEDGGITMQWARILAYITGKVDQELLLRNEYLAAENRILRD